MLIIKTNIKFKKIRENISVNFPWTNHWAVLRHNQKFRVKQHRIILGLQASFLFVSVKGSVANQLLKKQSNNYAAQNVTLLRKILYCNTTSMLNRCHSPVYQIFILHLNYQSMFWDRKSRLQLVFALEVLMNMDAVGSGTFRTVIFIKITWRSC